MFDNISVNQLKIVKDAEIIDIRSRQKYNDNHIMNAINIPFEQLIVSPNKYIKHDLKYYIYCQKGNKSRQLCQLLKRQGYNVTNIIGGYEAWILNE